MSRALVLLLALFSCRASYGVILANPMGIPPEFVGSSAVYQLCSDTDFDSDGDTDGSDVLQWQRKLGVTPPAPQMWGDANNDFKVSGTDLQLWGVRVGTPPSGIPDATCLKLFWDPKGITEGQITAYIEIANTGVGNRLHDAFVIPHPEYNALIAGTTITPISGGERYEYKVQFNAINPSNPPGGKIVIFGLEVMDMKPQLGIADIEFGDIGFEWVTGDFLTVFDPMAPPPQTETFDEGDLPDVPLSLGVPLVLNVDTASGAVTMQNQFGLPLDIKYYEITSASNALNVPGWVSFQDSIPGGDWVEAGGVGPGALGESNLLNSLLLLNGDGRSLGNAFNPGVGTRDLKFNFVNSDHTFLQGVVNYIELAPVEAVPEPGCLALVFLGFTGAAMHRRLSRRQLRLTKLRAFRVGDRRAPLMNVKAGFYFTIAALLLSNAAQASINYSGGSYTQNFGVLPNTPENVSLGNSPLGWTDDNPAPGPGNFSIAGWYLYHPILVAEGGFNGRQRLRAGAGTSGTGAFMSFGASGSAERALGMVGANTLAIANTGESYYGARFTNTSGLTLTRFTLSYTGEQWREGGGGAGAQSATFDYKVTSGSAAIQDAGFTDVSALNFTSPIFGGASGVALNGNASQNRTIKGPVTVSGLSWGPGQDLWIRWTDLNDAGNDHGLAIDDLTLDDRIPGDFNLDLDVDLGDYLTFSANLLTNVSTFNSQQTYFLGDMTGDLRIDGRDFISFYAAYDDANGVGAFVAMLAAVPEPSAGLLAGLGCGALCFRRRTGRGRIRTASVSTPSQRRS